MHRPRSSSAAPALSEQRAAADVEPRIVHLDFIHPGLYLGNHHAAKNERSVSGVAEGSTALTIVDATSKGFEEPLLKSRSERFGAVVKLAPYRDEPDTDFKSFMLWLNSGSWLLHDALQNESRVLLHCYEGVNRSVSLALAYGCRFRGKDLGEALRELRGAHWHPERVLSNPSFLENLKVWAQLTEQPRLLRQPRLLAATPASGGALNSRFVCYRVLRPDEAPERGIVARDPRSRATLQEHLDRGSAACFASAFISSTADLNIALRFALPFQRIARIDLAHFRQSGGEHVDLTTECGRGAALQEDAGATFSSEDARTFARRSAEVLLNPGTLRQVPQDCVVLMDHYSVVTTRVSAIDAAATPFPPSLAAFTVDAAAPADPNAGMLRLRCGVTGGVFTSKRGKPNVCADRLASWAELAAQLRTEFAAFRLARALGLPVLDVALYTFRVDGLAEPVEASCLVFAGDVAGLQAAAAAAFSGPGVAVAAAAHLSRCLVLDALLGNWLVAGTSKDPHVVLLGHQPVRVNLERCLGHRYQEDERHPEKGRHVVFGDDVEELCAMRLPPPDTAAQSPLRRACAAAYAACSDEAVRGQAAALLREGPGGGAAAVRAALAVAAAADDAPLLGRLERRLEYLRQLVALEARPGAPLPLSRAVVRVDAAGGDAPPAPRDGHTATPLPWRTNSCLVFGGHGDAEAYFDGFHELNLETRRWARLQVAGPGRPSPSPRHSHTAAAVGDFVLVYGGVGGLHHGGYLGDLSVLHVGVEGRVAALAVARAPGGDGGAAAPPPRGRHAAATALVRSGDSGALLHMYVYGGHDGRGKLDDLWRAEVAVGPADGCAAAVRWERLALPPAGQPPAMHRHALCLHAGRLLLFGGAWGGDSFATLWALDLAHPGRGFDARPTRDRGECGPLGQAGHCYVHDADAGRVYVVGGGSMHSSKGRASENFGRSPMRGRPGAGRKVRTFERVSMLDLNSAAWSVMRLEAPVGPANGYAAAIAACTSPAACVTQGGLLVHGGQNDAGKRRADTFLLVPRPLAR